VVTFYEKCTNKYGRVGKLRGVVSTLWVPIGYLIYNVLMTWAIITIYTSKCV